MELICIGLSFLGTELSAGICLCKLFVCAPECLCAYVIFFTILKPKEAELDLNIVQENIGSPCL